MTAKKRSVCLHNEDSLQPSCRATKESKGAEAISAANKDKIAIKSVL
jgi:hypothetical protein